MDSTKKIKQWKAFDFGPLTKKDSPKSTNSSKEIKVSNKNISKPFVVRKSFNFHEKLSPKSIAELAVHPKKVQEVQEWFKWNICQNKSETSKFLLLSGPTGSGKTATVSVLCNIFDISISEWVNPIDQDYEYRGMKQIDYFIEFLSESKYDSLFETSSRNRITLVKDFPNIVIQNPDQFFEILESCKYKTRQPIIFICTEASNTRLNLQRTLFPDEILQKFDVTHISFNACAPSLMKIALKRAQELVKSNSDIFKQPSSKIIDAILASADGDIRNAMNQFHMATLLGCEDLPTTKIKSEEKSTKRKRPKDEHKLNSMTKDQNLGLFHGLGRVLNPKRTPVGTSWRLSHNIETLVDEFSGQPQTFASFLFENYLKYFGDITDVAKSAEILSYSARFLENWERHETLVFALWISVLGLMIFNEHRVSKWTPIRAPIKIKTNRFQKELNVVLNPEDYFYYNIIKKSDKYHRFKLES